MKKVVELFMDEDDYHALDRLYELTKDPIVGIARHWCVEYEDQLKGTSANEFYMYDELIEYIWTKYNLNKYK